MPSSLLVQSDAPIWVRALFILPLLTALAAAAVIDCRRRKIPNIITFPVAVAGLIQAGLWAWEPSLLGAALGLLVGFSLMLPLYLLGAMGAGDVKLIAAVGAWLGPWLVIEVFLTAALAGLVVLLVQVIAARRLNVLLFNTGVLAMSLVHVRRLGHEQAATNGQTFRSVDKPLPYAVPVLIATAWVVLFGGLVLAV